MKLNRKQLDEAVKANILESTQAEALLAFLKQQNSNTPSFDFTHVLYYFGGLIAIGAMTLFMNLGWESFGGWGIVLIGLVYSLIGLALTHHFKRYGYAVPAGICATFVTCLTPLIVYGLQHAMGWWPDDSQYQDYHRYIKWHWLYMELATLVVAIILARIYRYPFLVMPIAVTLWYLTMDITVMLNGEWPSFELRALVSMYLGALMMGLAFWVDIRSRQGPDYAFWLYLFAVIAFWGGMTAQHSDNELSKFIYFSINLLMIIVGVALVRRVFVIFGALGSCFYLGHLANNVFADSWLFPITLSIIGSIIIYLGIVWQKNEQHITSVVRGWLPLPLQQLLESKES